MQSHFDTGARYCSNEPNCIQRRSRMTKILSLVIIGLMVIQIIKPLGLPGLKRRADFWKLAVLALALIVLTAGLSH